MGLSAASAILWTIFIRLRLVLLPRCVLAALCARDLRDCWNLGSKLGFGWSCWGFLVFTTNRYSDLQISGHKVHRAIIEARCPKALLLEELNAEDNEAFKV